MKPYPGVMILRMDNVSPKINITDDDGVVFSGVIMA